MVCSLARAHRVRDQKPGGLIGFLHRELHEQRLVLPQTPYPRCAPVRQFTFSVSFKLRQDDAVFAWVLRWAFRIAFLCITHGRSLWPVRGFFFVVGGHERMGDHPACEERTPWCSVTPARWPPAPGRAVGNHGGVRRRPVPDPPQRRLRPRPGLPGDAGRPALRGCGPRTAEALCRAQGNGGPASRAAPSRAACSGSGRATHGLLPEPRLERGGRDAELFRSRR